ncbi:unnamed protein product, partial [Meganyctiphanes norvegica]
AEVYQAKWAIKGSSYLKEEEGGDGAEGGGVKMGWHNEGIFETLYANIQCFPLVSYLRALNVTKVDLFSLDVEGAEEGILSTIPWSEVDISVLLLEHHGDSPDKDLDFVDTI